jgi:hypothetical protein
VPSPLSATDSPNVGSGDDDQLALMIAANVHAKTLSAYVGHSSIAITFDRYGKMMPGNESEAADLLDART